VLAEGPFLTPELLFDGNDSSSEATPAATLGDHLAVHERDYILRALDARGWQIQETAKLLGISRKNLWEKMKKHAISSAGEAETPRA
jgi:transcriptional regulator of acetoin/glycerol metabolism